MSHKEYMNAMAHLGGSVPDRISWCGSCECYYDVQGEGCECDVRNGQLEADIAVVEAAGCICYALWQAQGFRSSYTGAPKEQVIGQPFQVDTHDSRCPVALAKQMRERA